MEFDSRCNEATSQAQSPGADKALPGVSGQDTRWGCGRQFLPGTGAIAKRWGGAERALRWAVPLRVLGLRVFWQLLKRPRNPSPGPVNGERLQQALTETATS